MKKKNKLARWLRVVKRKISKLNRHSLAEWINYNLKAHPFILGLLIFIWFTAIVELFFKSMSLKSLILYHLKFHLKLFIIWFALVIFSNLLKEKKNNVKWYFKKRLVFILLILFFPIGILLLWIGAGFKRITKIILTAIFSFFFISGYIHQASEYQKLENMAPFERITDVMTKQKNKTFLKKAPLKELNNIVLKQSKDKTKIKMAASEIYSLSYKGIVTITTKDKTGNMIGQGSGFVISKDGYIATNSHVIKSAYGAEVKIDENYSQEALLVVNRPVFDIAVLKIDANNLNPLTLGNSDKVENGEVVITLSNPMGLEHSISSGIVSAVRSSRAIKLIQMTAPVSPGSSGGPVFNEYGEVVGIASMASFYLAQNLNFAIPINYLKDIIQKRK